jgi:hypothetical protein
MSAEQKQRKLQGERLRLAREAAGFKSARSAALENNWPESSYRAHESGTRTIGQDDADRYAKRFRQLGVHVTGQHILYGDAAPPDAITLPTAPIQAPAGLSEMQALVVETLIRAFLGSAAADPVLRGRLTDTAYQGALAVIIAQYARSRKVHEAVARDGPDSLRTAIELQLEQMNDSEPSQ